MNVEFQMNTSLVLKKEEVLARFHQLKIRLTFQFMYFFYLIMILFYDYFKEKIRNKKKINLIGTTWINSNLFGITSG